jgi:hypothetical protein
MSKITIKFDQKKFADEVTVGELIAMQRNDVAAIRDVLARFVVVDGQYLPQAEGVKLLDALTITQLIEAAGSFLGNAENTASPPENAPA